MKFVDQPGINLNAVQVRSADIPTMSKGTYNGIFVGTTEDADGNQWISVATTRDAHTEQSQLDVSKLKPGQQIQFTIDLNGGAIAYLVGNKYNLVGADGESLAEPLGATELYEYIKQHGIQLAQFVLTDIREIKG
mgnify:CR=1 FL=1